MYQVFSKKTPCEGGKRDKSPFCRTEVVGKGEKTLGKASEVIFSGPETALEKQRGRNKEKKIAFCQSSQNKKKPLSPRRDRATG